MIDEKLKSRPEFASCTCYPKCNQVHGCATRYIGRIRHFREIMEYLRRQAGMKIYKSRCLICGKIVEVSDRRFETGRHHCSGFNGYRAGYNYMDYFTLIKKVSDVVWLIKFNLCKCQKVVSRYEFDLEYGNHVCDKEAVCNENMLALKEDDDIWLDEPVDIPSEEIISNIVPEDNEIYLPTFCDLGSNDALIENIYNIMPRMALCPDCNAQMQRVNDKGFCFKCQIWKPANKCLHSVGYCFKCRIWKPANKCLSGKDCYLDFLFSRCHNSILADLAAVGINIDILQCEDQTIQEGKLNGNGSIPKANNQQKYNSKFRVAGTYYRCYITRGHGFENAEKSYRLSLHWENKNKPDTTKNYFCLTPEASIELLKNYGYQQEVERVKKSKEHFDLKKYSGDSRKE